MTVQGVKFTLTVIAVLLALPFLLPFLIVFAHVEKRRRRKAAREQACSACGATLGVEALEEADRRWREHYAELRRIHPRVKFRLRRSVAAICVRCGACYAYRADSRSFTPEPCPDYCRRGRAADDGGAQQPGDEAEK